MKNRHLKNKKGVIALTTLIIVTAILILGGVTLLLTSIDVGESASSSSSAILAELRAVSCFEEGLYRLRLDPSFIGTKPISYPESGVCTVDVSINIGNPDYRDLNITSTVEEFSYEEMRTVDITQDPIVVIN
ncbi:MAG: hypothetical protein ACE5DX_00855 [Candidatus Dojkabacteria bacterium]